MQIDLSGRVALVTGSTRGIGRSIAGTLALCGAKVAVVGRDQSRADAVASELGDPARGFSCDLSDTGQAASLVESVEKAFGSVDILVNNAGLTRDNLLLRM
jgi:3-oxoacyl-[acyl-carrier protein] reductase